MPYQKKIDALPNFRMEPNLVFELTKRLFAANSVKEAAADIGLPVQTVSRNFHRIRTALFENPAFYSLLRNYCTYENHAGRIYHATYFETPILTAQTISQLDDKSVFARLMSECLFDCPMYSIRGRGFSDSFSSRRYEPYFYETVAKDTPSLDVTSKLLRKKSICKNCPIEKEKNDTVRCFSRAPLVLIGIGHHFSKFRISSEDKFFFHYVNALSTSLWEYRSNIMAVRFNREELDPIEIMDIFFREYHEFTNACTRLLGLQTNFEYQFPVQR